jgi:hypothetical protein
VPHCEPDVWGEARKVASKGAMELSRRYCTSKRSQRQCFTALALEPIAVYCPSCGLPVCLISAWSVVQLTSSPLVRPRRRSHTLGTQAGCLRHQILLPPRHRPGPPRLPVSPSVNAACRALHYMPSLQQFAAIEELADGILRGCRLSVSRGVTLTESSRLDHQLQVRLSLPVVLLERLPCPSTFIMRSRPALLPRCAGSQAAARAAEAAGRAAGADVRAQQRQQQHWQPAASGRCTAPHRNQWAARSWQVVAH